MDNFLIALIDRRMKEMGYPHYTAPEPIRIKETVSDLTINAQNEFYFLTAKAVDASLIIRSDTYIFDEAADYASFNLYGIQEFTGQIRIAQGPAIDLEFVRVIPRTDVSENKQKLIDNFLQNVTL